MSVLTRKFVGSAALALGTLTSSVAPFTMANAQTKQSRSVAFKPIDFCQSSIKKTNYCAKVASNNKVVVILWGGTPAMREQAVEAMVDLNQRGYNSALIYGPDVDHLPTTAQVTFMVQGVDPFDKSFTVGTDHTDQIKPQLVMTTERIYREIIRPALAARKSNAGR